MAKSVVGLNIKIGATVASLQTDLNKASAAVRGFGNSAGGAAGGVNALGRANAALSSGIGRIGAFLKSQAASMIGIVAAMAAATVSVRGLTSAFTDIEDISNLADRIGATTESIVGLQKAAVLSGSSAEEMNSALTKMTRTVGNAIAGNKAAAKSFTSIGLSIDKLKTASPGEQIRLIAEAINGLGTQSEKAAAAQAIFGKGAADIVNVLAIGRKGFDEYQRAVEKSGEAFDKIGGDKVRAANDAIDNMKDSFIGVARASAITFAPAVEVAAKAIVSIIQAMRNLNAATVRTVIQIAAFAASFVTVIAIIPRLLAGLRAIVAGLKALSVASTFAQASTGIGLVKALAGVAVGIAAAVAVGKAFDKMTESAAFSASAARDAGDAVDELGRARDAIKPIPSIGAAVSGTTEGFNAVREGQKNLVDFAKRSDASDKKKEKLLDEIRKELIEIRKKTEPVKVKEHAII